MEFSTLLVEISDLEDGIATGNDMRNQMYKIIVRYLKEGTGPIRLQYHGAPFSDGVKLSNPELQREMLDLLGYIEDPKLWNRIPHF